MIQILHQLREAVIIGRYISGIHCVTILELYRKSLVLHGTQCKQSVLIQAGIDFFGSIEYIHLLR